MKSGSEQSFYLPTEVPERVVSTAATAGPWSRSAQHAGPPAGLLTRALTDLLTPDQVLGRIAIDLLGPVPVGPLSVSTSVVRSGRSVSLLSASLYDDEAGRECVTARAWVLPRLTSGPGSSSPPPHTPDDGEWTPLPPSWSRGYIDHVQWRWIKRAVPESGPAVVWMRPLVPLLPDAPYSGVTRLMTCIDSASGISSVLDPGEWSFMNTDLTVHLLREPVGEWVCIEAETTLGSTAAGMATSNVYDEHGLVARSAQALLILPRSR